MNAEADFAKVKFNTHMKLPNSQQPQSQGYLCDAKQNIWDAWDAY